MIAAYFEYYFSQFISGTPQDSGISLQTVLELGPSVPLFGVCMGLQCMGEAFGGDCVFVIDDILFVIRELYSFPS